MHPFLRCLTALGVLVLLGGVREAAGSDIYKSAAPAREVAIPAPGQVQSLLVHPASIDLVGGDDSRQLILTGTLAGGRLPDGRLQDGRVQDLTGNVHYDVALPAVVRVTPAGRVIPLANGSTTITARYGDHKATVPVTAAKI